MGGGSTVVAVDEVDNAERSHRSEVNDDRLHQDASTERHDVLTRGGVSIFAVFPGPVRLLTAAQHDRVVLAIRLDEAFKMLVEIIELELGQHRERDLEQPKAQRLEVCVASRQIDAELTVAREIRRKLG